MSTYFIHHRNPSRPKGPGQLVRPWGSTNWSIYRGGPTGPSHPGPTRPGNLSNKIPPPNQLVRPHHSGQLVPPARAAGCCALISPLHPKANFILKSPVPVRLANWSIYKGSTNWSDRLAPIFSPSPFRPQPTGFLNQLVRRLADGTPRETMQTVFSTNWFSSSSTLWSLQVCHPWLR